MTLTHSRFNVQKLSDYDALEQAQAAARQGNWSLLNQWLLQLLATDTIQKPTHAGHTTGHTSYVERSPHPPISPPSLTEQVLSLALEVLEWGEFHDRWDVATVFPKLGPPAIAPLTALLQDDDADPDLRWFVARILGEFHHPEVLATLIDRLKTAQQDDLRDMLATAVAGFGIGAIAPITELLSQEQTRLLAVLILSQIRHSETIPLLLTVVDDRQVPVGATAIEALSSFHHPSVPPVLVKALGDPAAQVRQAAVTGLGMRSDLLDEMNLVALIKPLLVDLHLEVCQQAAIALRRLGTDEAATALFQVVQSAHTPALLQLDGVRALGWMGTPTALTYLQQILTTGAHNSAWSSLCQEIVTVLGQVKFPMASTAAQMLIHLLQTNHPAIQTAEMKQILALNLGHLGYSDALDPLIDLLAEADDGVRFHAIAALKTLDSYRAYTRLQHLAQTPSLNLDLQRGVAIALQEWDM